MYKQLLWVCGLAILLAGCRGGANFIRHTQPIRDLPPLIIQDGASAGQTFVAHYAGLAEIRVFLQPGDSAEGDLVLHLRPDVHATQDVAQARLPLDAITAPDYYAFSIPPQPNSDQRSYYFFLEVRGAGQVAASRSGGDAYLNGAMHTGHTPLDAQMAFKAGYSPRQMLRGFAALALRWGAMLAAGAILFVLPGWALLNWAWPNAAPLPWPAKLGLAPGVSLGVYFILLVWTDLMGWHWGAAYAWAPPLLGAGWLLWQTRRQPPPGKTAPSPHLLRAWQHSPNFWPDLAFIVLTLAIFATRFWVIRTLDIPMWGDSYQHTMIAQLLVDNSGLFDSWQPYAELVTFTYHFGFHAATAVFHWLTRLPMPQAILWTGQLLNGLAVLALYPLAAKIGKSRWAGVGAVLVAGLLLPMPMFYVNWGRYTQLAGQLVLPAAIFLSWQLLADKIRPRRMLPLVWLSLSGLGMAHYRVLIFGVLFFPAFLLVYARKDNLREIFTRFVWAGTGAGLAFAPWFWRAFSGKILAIFSAQISRPAQTVPAELARYNAFGDLSVYAAPFFWVLLLVCLGWGLWRRNRGAGAVGLWWLFIMLAANPAWLLLPGTGALSNFAVLIAAYIPIGILVGAALGWALAHAQAMQAAKWRPIAIIFFTVMGVALVGWGARQRVADLQVSEHALATRPDLHAAAWIDGHVPPEARFMVNSFSAFFDTSIVGADGGWWLPLLAQRDTTLPPITYGFEQGPRPDYQTWINALTAEVRARGLTDPQTRAMLAERGVTHVYIGQRQGLVNTAAPLLPLNQLLEDPAFQAIYHQDRVWIFEIVDAAP